MSDMEQNVAAAPPTPAPTNQPSTKPKNPLGIKLVAWGCFVYPALVLVPVIYASLKYIKSFDMLVKFFLGGLVWGYTYIFAFYFGFLLVTGIISIILGRALLKREKYAYLAILLFSIFLIAFQSIVVYVNGTFKVESFSLLSVWCVFVLVALIIYRKLF